MKDLEKGEIQVTVPSHTRFVHLVTSLASHAASIAGFDKQVSGKVALATDEAVTNVIRHAYDNQPNHKVTVTVEINPESLILRIYHTGKALRKEDIRLPVMEDYIKERRQGGLGLFIINQFMDQVDYLVGEENCCQMIKYRDQADT
jgi:serine/threonine-protein kinase RsbW